MSHENIVVLDNDNFDKEVLECSTPVLVDVWAPWCGPCMALAPVLDEISLETVDYAKICKVNVDECPDIVKKLKIRNIPTLLFYKSGELYEKKVGVIDKEEIIGILKGNA